MGRLSSSRARLLLTLCVLVALPLAAVLGRGLVQVSGAPLVTVVLAVLVVHALSVGPRAMPVAVVGFVLDAWITRGLEVGPGVVAVAVVQAVVVVIGVRLLELRFAHHGPVRRPVVMVEFGVIGAGLVPFGVFAADHWVGGLLGLPTPGVPLLQCAVAAGIGVLTLTPGLRMFVKGQHRGLDRRRLLASLAAAGASGGAVLAVVLVAGQDAIVAGQVLVIPVLALGLLVGTVAYSLAVGTTLLSVSTAFALAGVTGEWELGLTTIGSWWLLSFVGLLLATEGDRRRAAELEFRSFFLRSSTPSLTVNTSNGVVLRANDAVARLLDWPVDEIIGSDVADLLRESDHLHHRLGLVRTGELDEVVEEFALDVEGGERWVRCVAVRVELGGPQHDVVQVQFVDLTEERDRAASLERSNESLEQFGRRVTHDLKQPVAAVAAYASTLLEHGERMDEEMVRTMHERLAAASRRAAQQLDDTFAAAAARDPGRVDVRLHELVADVLGVVDIDLAESGGTVATNLMRGQVFSKAAVLRQVLLNLVTNSLKYAGDEPPHIHITSRVRGAGVEITVTDNGIGIPVGSHEDVFERGVRLAPEHADGVGHGLADSRELAESLGGSLTAEPWPDGARFVLWLPDPSAAGAQPATRVLVVATEDEGAVLTERLGHRSSVAFVGATASMEEAVLVAADVHPDVVLLDRSLFDRAGREAVVEVARSHRDARFVLLTTGGRRSADVDAAAVAGAVGAVDLSMADDELVGGLIGLPG